MTKSQWARTITIELNGLTRHYIRLYSTRDAAEYLIDAWPGKRDDAYRAAVVACTKVIRGEMADDAAFVSFLMAARTSNLNFFEMPEHPSDDFERELISVTEDILLEDLRSALPN